MEGTPVDGSWSGFADDLFIKDELPDHTVESAEDIILNNAASLDATRAEDRKISITWRLYPASADTKSNDGSHRWSLSARSWAEPGTSEAATPSTGATVEIEHRLQSMAANWSPLGGFGLHVRLGATDASFSCPES